VDPKKSKRKIIFSLSCNELESIKYIHEIPVLFPINKRMDYYYIDDRKNLIFIDDLLKSSFYLLSGYQETQPFVQDEYERFNYQESIQKKLKDNYSPLVNEYFNIIIQGIKEFCDSNKIGFKLKNLWSEAAFGFMLTHDVDRVDKYTFSELKLRIKQMFKNSSDHELFTRRLKKAFLSFTRIFTGSNPYWNFDWLIQIENRYNLNSTWFFLPQGERHMDAYYSLNEARIMKLVEFLASKGDEIALHGTVKSGTDLKILKDNLSQFETAINSKPIGNRQHWLRFEYPNTLRNLESVGIQYDSSWGFPDRVGWRNSYCHPFHPYDLEEDRMMNIWEFPLCVMDVTLFQYMKLSNKDAEETVYRLLSEVQKHRGLLVLLWHNSFFDEDQYPGLSKLYQQILSKIAGMECMQVTGSELLKILNHYKD